MKKSVRLLQHTLLLSLAGYLLCGGSPQAASGAHEGPSNGNTYGAPSGAPFPLLAQSVLLFEDFEDGEADGFNEVSGKWSVVRGMYTQSADVPPGPYLSWVSAGPRASYTIDVDCLPLSGQETKVIYARADTTDAYRVDFWLDRCRLSMPVWGENWDSRSFTVEGLKLSYDKPYHVKINVRLEGVMVWVNDLLLHEQPWADGTPLGDGRIGLGTYDGTSSFDNLLVRARRAGPSQYAMYFDYTPLSGQETKIIYAHADASENYRVDIWLDHSRLCIPAWCEAWDTRSFETWDLKLAYGQTYYVAIDVGLSGVRVWINDSLLHEQPWADSLPLGDGKVGVGTFDATASFDNLLVYETGQAPKPLLDEDFDDAVADGFTEVGGEWIADGLTYTQRAVDPPGPYRSWVDAADLTEITTWVRPQPVLVGQSMLIYGSLTDLRGKALADRTIEINIFPPKGETEVLGTQTDTRGNYALSYTPLSAGTGWQAVASWPGDLFYDGADAKPPAQFDVLAADTRASISLSASAIHWSDTLNVFGQLKPVGPVYDLVVEGETVYLHFEDAATGERPQPASTTVDAGGYYSFEGIKFPEAGLWKLWVEYTGSLNLNPSVSRDVYVQIKDSAGQAILVSGKGNDDTGLDSNNRTTDTIYHKLCQRGFPPESIFYLRFGVPPDNGILLNGPPSKEGIAQAIMGWAKNRMISDPGPLFIVLIGPGEPWHFFVSGEKETVIPWELNEWMTNLEKSLIGSAAEGQPIILMYGAPYSGGVIPWLSSTRNPRVIVTSSDSRELPVTGPLEDGSDRQGEFFMEKLFESLVKGLDLTRSFCEATGATQLYTSNVLGNGLSSGLAYPDLSAHHPLLDDNGDRIGSFAYLSTQPGHDGYRSSRIILGYGPPAQEAEIVQVSPRQIISLGEVPQIWARVNDRDLVHSVWTVIKPPGFELAPTGSDTWVHRDVDGTSVLLYDLDRDGIYIPSKLPGFTRMGTYQVLFFIKDINTGQLGKIWKSKIVVTDPNAPEPGEFSLSSPEDGETVGSQILLTWQESQKGSAEDEITYTVQIATDPSFNDIVFEQTDIEGTSLLIGEDAGLFDKTTYYWRVRAENFFGQMRFARTLGMRSIDIGQPLKGTTFYDPAEDSYTIEGGGISEPFGPDDQFRFVHTSAGGSFEATVRMDFLETVGSSSFAGLMIRESTDTTSRYAMAGATSRGLFFSAFRASPGSPPRNTSLGDLSLPSYLKLTFHYSATTGSAEVTPSASRDGKTWDPQEPMTLFLPGSVQIGICVNSADPDRLLKAVVSGFTVTPLDRKGVQPLAESSVADAQLSVTSPPAEPLGNEYSTFNTSFGGGLPGYNVLTVLVYNENDPSESPPNTTITISPIVGTVHNWMYTGYVPVGTYDIDVSAPSFSPESRTAQVTTDSATTEVFTLTPNAGSVSGKVISANDASDLRGAAVQLEVASGIYLGMTYDAVTGMDGRFSFTSLPGAVDYTITVTKTYYTTYQDSFSLGAGEARDLGTLSLGFTDADGDGLPDEFEQIIVDFDPEDGITDIRDVHGDDDFDGDGKSNGDELLSGTDPALITSCLRIISVISNSSDSLTVTWTSVTGMLYSIYYSDHFGGWTLADSDIAGSGTGENSWTDNATSGTIPPPGDVSLRYYRVQAY